MTRNGIIIKELTENYARNIQDLIDISKLIHIIKEKKHIDKYCREKEKTPGFMLDTFLDYPQQVKDYDEMAHEVKHSAWWGRYKTLLPKCKEYPDWNINGSIEKWNVKDKKKAKSKQQ